MQYAPPSAEEAARLLAEHAYRHPEKATITVPGDRGASVRLPLIIGNPSGSCRLPATLRPSPAWNDSIAVTLGVRKPEDTDADQLGADCVLWPPLATWNEWVDRWPGLPGRVADLARQKFGGVLSAVAEPAFDAVPPPAIGAALDAHPRAAWRIVAVPGCALHLVVDTPSPATYGAFMDSIRRAGSDPWKLTGELVRGCVPLVLDGTAPVTIDDMLDRWPGVGVVLIAVIAQLAGAGAEVRLGEW